MPAASSRRCGVSTGDGPVPPPTGGPVEREGDPGAADQPHDELPGKAGQPGGLGDGQVDGAEAGRAGLAPSGRAPRIAEENQQVSITSVASVLGAASDESKVSAE